MQIRLTVVDPLGLPSPELSASPEQGPPSPRGRVASRDVLVTAPAGTALSAVASALAAAVSGDTPSGPAVLYAGTERLDPQRCTLGEPPLLDGAVLAVGGPAAPEPHPELDDAPARLDVIAGPDAGGVHLLHGGEIRVGRSAEADVPLDDPDVSRVHCAVTLGTDGRVSVADLDSTNGTTLDGTRVGTRPVRFTPGALLRIGESTLRLAPAGGPGRRVGTAPDGEGCVRVGVTDGEASAAGSSGARASGPSGRTGHAYGAAAGRGTPGGGSARSEEPGSDEGRGAARTDREAGAPGAAHHPARTDQEEHPRAAHPGAAPHDRHTGAARPDPRAREHPPVAPPLVPEQGGPPRIETRDAGPQGPHPGPGPAAPSGDGTHGGRAGVGAADPTATQTGRRKGTPLRGTDVPPGVRRRGGLTAWARRLAGGRGGEQETAGHGPYDDEPADAGAQPPVRADAPEAWPDPAALLLTALGPGPRLWEREPGHPEALTVRLGTADRVAPDGSGLLPAVPVTADLREVGALGLAGPRPRLAGLARAVLAQLAALHSPDALEIVLISTDRARSLEERTAEWSWLGWLPHLRPAHGQDCRLLLAHDREQAAARTDELLRRLDDHLAERRRTTGQATAPAATADQHRAETTVEPDQRHADPAGTPNHPHVMSAHAPDQPHAGRTGEPDQPHAKSAGVSAPATAGAARHPSWARSDDDLPAGAAHSSLSGPHTVLVVDGDPGGAGLREAVARLALEGPRAGIHVVCLAETAPASPASPVTDTFEAACATAPVFRECGAVALLSGDVATALRLLRVARTGAGAGSLSRSGTDHPAPVGHGTVGTVDAVSPAWAERFARALAPLRTDATGTRHARVSAPLPQAARLLDELGLARATPASLMARWADAADDTDALGGRAHAVLGAGPRGPVAVDFVADGPHLLVEGPPGSGRTELLRAVVASLAAAERPDRLSLALMDGRDSVGAGSGHGDGLYLCLDIPHVTTHLLANDPVRMREFAQSLTAELKRRAELLGRSDFTEWHTGREVSGRMVSQRPAPASGASGAADLDTPPSATLRLRPAAPRRPTDDVPPLPRLVVVVDDLDALVSPPLGSPGRPAAGSVMRALETVARDGERLGVHLVAAAGPGGRTAETEPVRRATLRVALDAPAPGPDEPAPGRGRLTHPDGRITPFQGGRVTGRIPRTATLRPTVVPLEWHRMGDPPARRPVRELGNGPTDLALLASALERAAREVSAPQVPSLL
ncbi:FHA domain-containing protein [Streptomyces chromofuscus]|uniref:FHA domain-containing protein n=1 Tax=Streptomyces chromofuscus TaxID=42881 RepID=A0A7M2TFS5_STRCW|nr:FHA domain-containing protein [Streptomyces chromofuscus]QOV47596.1 FHA domain-containing protein [Streptomyces chromofuscus]